METFKTMEITRVEIIYGGTTTQADTPSVALTHWCISHGILGRIDYQRVKQVCLERFHFYPKILDYPVNFECREDYAIGILFWLRERGDIQNIRFSVMETGVGTGHLNDLMTEYDFHQASENSEWRITYNVAGRLIFPPPDDSWKDFGQVVYDNPELKRNAIRNFVKRKTFANYKQQNDPTVVRRGEPMMVFCIYCGMPTETIEEDFLFDTNDKCSQCRALDNRGWLHEAKLFWEGTQKEKK